MFKQHHAFYLLFLLEIFINVQVWSNIDVPIINTLDQHNQVGTDIAGS